MPITVQTAAQNSWWPVFLVVALRIDRVPEQIHVVRSLISDDPSVVSSVDVVRWFTGLGTTPAHLLFYRMEGLLCIGLRSLARLT